MRFLKRLVSWLLLPALLTVTMLGCMLADQGAKKIGGYFEDNTVFAVTPTEDWIEIILFNQTFKIRR